MILVQKRERCDIIKAMKTYPLTETQLGMYLEWNADRMSAQYSVPLAYWLPKSADLDRLEKAIREFVDAYPVFRTRLVETEEGVRQGIDEGMEIPFVRLTMTKAEAERYLKEIPRPFDAFGEPLCRFDLIKTPDGGLLIMEFFHLITDGTSLRILQATVSSLYNGEPFKPDEEMTFQEYAASDAASCETAEYREAADAAKARFAGKAMTEADAKNRPLGKDGDASGRSGNAKYLSATAEMKRAAVETWCREKGVHPNLFFMGAFARTLALYANEKDVVFYTVYHGRREEKFRRTQGLLVKTIPVLGEIRGEMGLADYCRSFKQHKAGVYPFTHFCRDLGMRPGWGLVFQDGTIDMALTLGAERVEGRMLSSGGAGQVPTMQVIGTRDGFRLEITAQFGRYDEAFLQGFVERCVTVAENFLKADDGARVGSVPVLSEEETRRVLAMSKGEELEYDSGKTFVDLFKAQAKARPDAMAVTDGEASLTYGELDAQSDALAAELARLGVEPGGFVGLMLPRTVAFPVSFLAAQKCGAGYVPMDPEYPTDRLAYMLENSEAKVLVTGRSIFEGKKIDFKGKVVVFEEWKSGMVERWKSGKVEEWKSGMVEGWKGGRG